MVRFSLGFLVHGLSLVHSCAGFFYLSRSERELTLYRKNYANHTPRHQPYTGLSAKMAGGNGKAGEERESCRPGGAK
jgi:hypothetical protein